MELLGLILYGAVNAAMVLRYFIVHGRFYEFPFWAGVIALGWFYPMAIGGYSKIWLYPEGAYASGMFFASLCTVALWFGFELALRKGIKRNRLFEMQFNKRRLYHAGGLLIIAGFFFQWKLWSLSDEMLARPQWSGAAVKYLFLASIFKIGFLVLLVQYLRSRRWLNSKYLVFLIPCLLLILSAAFLHGRRAEMMNLFTYILVSLWFVRGVVLPRGLLLATLILGIMLINGIGQYRFIIKDERYSLKERIIQLLNTDMLASTEHLTTESGRDFRNYIMYRHAVESFNTYDYGLVHWNGFVFNYVPAQIVGRELKKSLMIPLPNVNRLAEERYGYAFWTGTVSTGYRDAFGSFWWFGCVKFLLIGWIMGVLYRYAINRSFLAQILYVYVLTAAMHAISHGTNQVLVSVWVYFFVLGFPLLYWARARLRRPAGSIGRKTLYQGQVGRL